MSYPVTQLTTVTIPNGSLTAANYNAEFQNVYANVGKPENIDDYSENVSEMQTEADPGELGSESQATSLSAEIERIRFAIKEVKQKIDPTVAHWYQTPGTLNLGGVANTDTFTIYAQNDAFTETVLTLKTDTVSGTGYKFLECIVDVNGTPATKVTLDGQGNLVLGGTLTTTGLLTVNDIPGVKADKLILAEAGTGVNHITLQGPDSASTTTHVITLPGALPASQSFMLIDAAGLISYSVSSVVADNIGLNMTSVGANAIASTMTSTGANAIFADVTTISATQADSIAASMTATGANTIADKRTRPVGQTVGVGGVAISPSSGTYNNTGSWADVTNLSVTLSTIGRPVRVYLVSDTTDGVGVAARLTAYSAINQTLTGGYIRCYRNVSILVGTGKVGAGHGLDSSYNIQVSCPIGSVEFLDFPPAGTHTYKITCANEFPGSGGLFVTYARLVAEEI